MHMVKFRLGQTVATPGALEALIESGEAPIDFLRRHVHGDWGDCGAEDAKANEDALLHEGRLMSVYKTNKSVKLWVITEHDRSVTTILLPEEY